MTVGAVYDRAHFAFSALLLFLVRQPPEVFLNDFSVGRRNVFFLRRPDVFLRDQDLEFLTQFQLDFTQRLDNLLRKLLNCVGIASEIVGLSAQRVHHLIDLTDKRIVRGQLTSNVLKVLNPL